MAHQQKARSSRKVGRNKDKCAAYRARVGKPNGPGRPGRKTKA
jgi:hypothetical protein